MPFTNFPNGVASFGVPSPTGGIYDVPSGEVLFVCNRAGVTNGAGTSRDQPLTSIADAIVQIATTNPSKAAIVFVLAGHAENVTGSNIFSASLVNTTAVTIPLGTRIIGEGTGMIRPTLTFTAAGSTVALAAANCTIENMILLCPQAGVVTCAAMVTVTAAGCKLLGLDQQLAASATALATTGISLSSAANDCEISNFPIVYDTTGTPTSWLSTTGTAAPARVKVLGNNVSLSLSSASGGCVDGSAATVTPGVDWVVVGNFFGNNTAASTVAAKFFAGWTGAFAYNSMLTINAATTTAVTAPGNMGLIGNFVSQPTKFGIAAGPGGTAG